MLLLNREFNVDSIPVDTPGESDFLAQESLAPSDNINHAVLSNRPDMPGTTGIWRRCVDNENLSIALRIERVSILVSLLVMLLLNALLQINRPPLVGYTGSTHHCSLVASV